MSKKQKRRFEPIEDDNHDPDHGFPPWVGTARFYGDMCPAGYIFGVDAGKYVQCGIDEETCGECDRLKKQTH